jgi:GH35 family endo-1,4-beta-xylanase
MQEFKGRVYAWDVVNEAVVGYDASNQDVGEDLGKLKRWGYRNSKWYQIAGEDHIFEAFRAAREADRMPNSFTTISGTIWMESANSLYLS